METASRHIRKLKISAQTELSAYRAQTLLKEAFKVSSFPDHFTNRLVLVKRLNIGSISGEISTQALAEIIGDKVKSIASHAICVDSTDSPNADIIWFSNHSQPFFLLIEKQLLRAETSAWYWIVIKKRFALPRSNNIPLSTLINKLGESDYESLIFVSLLQFLLEKKCLLAFLSDLQPQSVDYMLQHSGISLSMLKSELVIDNRLTDNKFKDGKNRKLNTSSAVKYILQQKIFSSEILKIVVANKSAEWGQGDLRTFFLVYHSLLITNPALLHSSRKIEYIFEVIESLLTTQVDDMDVGSNVIALNSSDEQGDEISDSPIPDLHREEDNINQDLLIKNRVTKGLLETKSEIDASAQNVTTMSREKSFYVQRNKNDGAILQRLEQDDLEQIKTYALEFNDAVFTHFAGLGYFIRLLEVIGLLELLERNPLLAEWNFPAILIAAVAKRVGIDGDNPIIGFLGEAQVLDEKIQVYTVPDEWLNFIYLDQPLELQSDDAVTEQFRLVDAKGLIIAQWCECMPVHLNELLTIHDYVKRKKKISALSIDEITRNILIITCRYLRQVAGLSLRALICKPGKFEMTKTHLDFIYDGNDIDIRVRRVGLDINPGWVSWLGRVVNFQYCFDNGDNDIG